MQLMKMIKQVPEMEQLCLIHVLLRPNVTGRICTVCIFKEETLEERNTLSSLLKLGFSERVSFILLIEEISLPVPCS